MNEDELKQVLALHRRWRVGDKDGRCADLTGADLTGAHLWGADFTGADLTGADLTGAHLWGADLTGAELAGAKLTGAELTGASGILTAGPCDTWMIYAVRWNDGPRIAAGCRWFTVAEARDHWSGATRPEHAARMIAGIEALLALARAHSWEMPAEDAAQAEEGRR